MTTDDIPAADSPPPPQPPTRRVCFSFAAYSKALIDHLRTSGIPVADGLTDSELAAIESLYAFEFPPDLRSILREGLPLGTGFPNWRSASPQQLEILLALPVSGLLNEVSKGTFWCDLSWGLRPTKPSDALRVAKGFLDPAPVLVPVYRQYYVPSRPGLAGNPVLFVRGGEVRVAALDLADFFQREEFTGGGGRGGQLAPAWAATEARRVEVWTGVAEGAGEMGGGAAGKELARCMREVGWRLREGGWREEDVREMLMDGGGGGGGGAGTVVLGDRESVAWHVRVLGLALLRGGWSAEDVVYSMDGGGVGGGGGSGAGVTGGGSGRRG